VIQPDWNGLHRWVNDRGPHPPLRDPLFQER
jgi:hypothetical protein